MINIFQIVRSIKKDNFDNYQENMNMSYINAVDETKSNLLHAAIAYKHDKIALDLIAKGVNVNHQNKKGQTPLHLAASHNNINVAEEILKNGGNININDEFGNNALWTAVMNAKGKYDLVSLFVEYKGDANNKNNNGKSPLDFAEQINDNTLITLLTNKT